MKYKIYQVKNDEVTKVATFIETDFNIGCGFDTIEEAMNRIQTEGEDYIQYTILPYIYMINF